MNEVQIRYRNAPDAEWTHAVLRGDWADICNAVRKRIHPGVTIEHYRPKVKK